MQADYGRLMAGTCMRLAAHLTRTRSQPLQLEYVVQHYTYALLRYRRALRSILQQVTPTAD